MKRRGPRSNARKPETKERTLHDEQSASDALSQPRSASSSSHSHPKSTTSARGNSAPHKDSSKIPVSIRFSEHLRLSDGVQPFAVQLEIPREIARFLLLNPGSFMQCMCTDEALILWPLRTEQATLMAIKDLLHDGRQAVKASGSRT
jgi:hypothetical protein